MAGAASDLLEKTDLLEIEKTWLSLARGPELWARRTSNTEPFPRAGSLVQGLPNILGRPKNWAKANCLAAAVHNDPRQLHLLVQTRLASREGPETHQVARDGHVCCSSAEA